MSEAAVVPGTEPQVLVTGVASQGVVEFMISMDFMTPAYLRAAFKKALGLKPGSPEDFHFPEDAVVYVVDHEFYLEYRDAVQALRSRG